MEKKQTIWKTKGMNQDLSVSAFNNEFSFENMNLRLSTNEGNTLMSWVNEKGTSLMHLSISIKEWEEDPTVSEIIQGCPIGTAVINHQLVLFTTYPSKRKGFKTSTENTNTVKKTDNNNSNSSKKVSLPYTGKSIVGIMMILVIIIISISSFIKFRKFKDI